MKLLIYGLVIYFLYKVIFDIVVPVSNGVKTVRQNMEQMQEAAKTAAANTTTTQKKAQQNAAATAPKEAEYIDFEEVKK
jgi:6,7-dimethyl-8-ribityllumazine synthase